MGVGQGGEGGLGLRAEVEVVQGMPWQGGPER